MKIKKAKKQKSVIASKSVAFPVTHLELRELLEDKGDIRLSFEAGYTRHQDGFVISADISDSKRKNLLEIGTVIFLTVEPSDVIEAESYLDENAAKIAYKEIQKFFKTLTGDSYKLPPFKKLVEKQ